MKRLFMPLGIFLLLCSFPLVASASGQESTARPDNINSRKVDSSGTRPNILFIVMDDVGIDQMRIFGYGGVTPPNTPNIDAIARAGVRFRNVWSMPECSPSRAIFFEGRYPFRTNIYSAILSIDLANSQVSPYEVTTPKLLRTRHYQSAMFGKFHLAGPNNNPFKSGTPHALGWDYFDGFLEGAPYPIDTTIGGQFPANTYTCGFVPNAHFPGGADSGACHQPDGTCTNIKRDASHPTPGLSCVEEGGLFVPKQACDAPLQKTLNFDQTNAYYVWNRVINHPDGSIETVPLTDRRARGYMSDATTKAAADWINQQNGEGKPWMATASYSNIHTPYQQPPRYLLAANSPDTAGFQCTGNTIANIAATRAISNQMVEAMDTEIGQLLVNTELASRTADGKLDYHPEKTHTMVVIIGDNGTFAPGVKQPFDSTRAKGYVNQTGVWVPLIVSGPLVARPGREVKDMVNIADLYQLFGEIAGIDVHKVVPKSHILDSQSMLPYLTDPNHPSIRQTNFTQTASNIHTHTPPPCVIPLTTPASCVQLFDSKGLCETEGGDWYGENPSIGTTTYDSCCEVKNANLPNYPNGIQLLPVSEVAMRNNSFKLIRKVVQDCSTGTDQTVTELYKVDEKAPVPAIDKEDLNLCGPGNCPAGLPTSERKNYKALLTEMDQTLASEPACPGDGNEDKRVNLQDAANWKHFELHDGGSSWYDFNHDGITNSKDLGVIAKNLGRNCLNSR